MSKQRHKTKPVRPRIWIAALELTTGLALVGLDLWCLRALEDQLWHVLALAGLALLLAGSHLRRRRLIPSPESKQGVTRAWTEAAFGSLLAGVCLVLLGGWTREPYEGFALGGGLVGDAGLIVRRLGIAVGQQIGLQWFLWPVTLEMVGGKLAACGLAAVLFGLLHLPSPFLVLATALGAVGWISLFRRGGRLAPLVFSHFALALVLQASLPERIHYDLRVGSEALWHIGHFRLLSQESTRERIQNLTSADYYAAQGGTDEAYIEGLFKALLSRRPTPAELTAWLEELRGTSRGHVVADLIRIRERDSASLDSGEAKKTSP